MEKKMHLGLVAICLAMSSLLCRPIEAAREQQATEVAGYVHATLTAQAPTPTLTPTITPSPIPPPTSTLTPTLMPTATPRPLSEGWLEYAIDDFHIALPGGWVTVDMTEEAIESLLGMLEVLDTEWAQEIAPMISSADVGEMVRFWAFAPEMVGSSIPNVNVIRQELPFPIATDDLVTQLEFTYEQMAIEVVETETGLEINGLEAAQLTLRTPISETIVAQQAQYVYTQGNTSWILSFTVDEVGWQDYEPIFTQIAEGFWVD